MARETFREQPEYTPGYTLGTRNSRRFPQWVPKWESNIEKTHLKVKHYPPIIGAAEGCPHKGRYFCTVPAVFFIFGPYVGTHSVNSLSQGYNQLNFLEITLFVLTLHVLVAEPTSLLEVTATS